MKHLTIGIDPGKITGFAVYCRNKRGFLRLEGFDFWRVYGEVLLLHPEAIAMVYIEVPDTKHVWQNSANGLKAIQRQAVNVGSVIREGEILCEGIERAGYPVRRMNPRGKVDAGKFKMITGWQGTTNQHMRDAGLLCFGR